MAPFQGLRLVPSKTQAFAALRPGLSTFAPLALESDGCGERFPLWDALEKKFASAVVRAHGEQLQAMISRSWIPADPGRLLRRESANGTKLVKQFEFKGERLDLSSVRRWRERLPALKTS